jgi:hypothetical protein
MDAEATEVEEMELGVGRKKVPFCTILVGDGH